MEAYVYLKELASEPILGTMAFIVARLFSGQIAVKFKLKLSNLLEVNMTARNSKIGSAIPFAVLRSLSREWACNFVGQLRICEPIVTAEGVRFPLAAPNHYRYRHECSHAQSSI